MIKEISKQIIIDEMSVASAIIKDGKIIYRNKVLKELGLYPKNRRKCDFSKTEYNSILLVKENTAVIIPFHHNGSKINAIVYNNHGEYFMFFAECCNCLCEDDISMINEMGAELFGTVINGVLSGCDNLATLFSSEYQTSSSLIADTSVSDFIMQVFYCINMLYGEECIFGVPDRMKDIICSGNDVMRAIGYILQCREELGDLRIELEENNSKIDVILNGVSHISLKTIPPDVSVRPPFWCKRSITYVCSILSSCAEIVLSLSGRLTRLKKLSEVTV